MQNIGLLEHAPSFDYLNHVKEEVEVKNEPCGFIENSIPHDILAQNDEITLKDKNIHEEIVIDSRVKSEECPEPELDPIQPVYITGDIFDENILNPQRSNHDRTEERDFGQHFLTQGMQFDPVPVFGFGDPLTIQAVEDVFTYETPTDPLETNDESRSQFIHTSSTFAPNRSLSFKDFGKQCLVEKVKNKTKTSKKAATKTSSLPKIVLKKVSSSSRPKAIYKKVSSPQKKVLSEEVKSKFQVFSPNNFEKNGEKEVVRHKLVCGVCSAVRFYAHLKQAKKFGIHSCESCRKFISRIITDTSKEILKCNSNTGKCVLPGYVRNPDTGMILPQNIRCKACWLKLCIHNYCMSIELKKRLKLRLPSFMRNKDYLPTVSSFISDKGMERLKKQIRKSKQGKVKMSDHNKTTSSGHQMSCERKEGLIKEQSKEPSNKNRRVSKGDCKKIYNSCEVCNKTITPDKKWHVCCTGWKKYVCSLCMFRTAILATMKTHFNSHLKEVSCSWTELQ